MTARVRPLKEGKFHPSLLLGVDDPFKNTGINYFDILFIYQLKQKKILWDDFRLFTTLKKQYTHHILKIGLPVAVLNTLFAFVNMFLGRTATEQGGHLGLMALTTGGQIEAITWNTSQGFSTALSAFVAQNYAARQISRVLKAYRIASMPLDAWTTPCLP